MHTQATINTTIVNRKSIVLVVLPEGPLFDSDEDPTRDNNYSVETLKFSCVTCLSLRSLSPIHRQSEGT